MWTFDKVRLGQIILAYVSPSSHKITPMLAASLKPREAGSNKAASNQK